LKTNKFLPSLHNYYFILSR